MTSKNQALELTREMVERNDEVTNSVFDCLKVLLNNPDLEWDMAVICDVIEAIDDTLSTRHDLHICYPFIETSDYEQDSYCSLTTCSRESCPLHHSKE